MPTSTSGAGRVHVLNGGAAMEVGEVNGGADSFDGLPDRMGGLSQTHDQHLHRWGRFVEYQDAPEWASDVATSPVSTDVAAFAGRLSELPSVSAFDGNRR